MTSLSHIAGLIHYLHLALVLAIAISPLIANRTYKRYALIFLIFLLGHYLTNYGRCGLTELEGLLLGESYQSGFLYRLITPVLKVPPAYFDLGFYILHLSYILVLAFQVSSLQPDKLFDW
jgi:hypothetical protein